MQLSLLSERLLSRACNQWKWWWEASSERDELARALLTVSLFILPIFWILWIASKSRKAGVAPPPAPPGPHGMPIVGYLPFLGTNLCRSFTELAEQYGPIFKLWLGKKLCVVVSSPSLAKEVVRDHDAVFANRDPPRTGLAATYGGLDIAWSPYGAYWRATRKLFSREMLSNTSLEASYNLRRDEVRKTVREVHGKIGSAIDIEEVAFLTAFKVAMAMLWGGTVDSQRVGNIGAEFRMATAKMVELMAVPNVSDFFPMLARFDVQGLEQEARQILKQVEQIIDPIIEAGLNMGAVRKEELRNEGRKDFLQILLGIKETGGAEIALGLEEIKALLIDIVVGGTETSATTVVWAMTEIMNNPEIMRRVQDELSNIVGMDNVVEESHLPKLHYLNAVLKESFRLHPPLPLLVPRCPSESSIVGGYTIPKDTRVFLNVWAMHRDPEVWDEPSKFKPERFLGGTGNWDFNGNNFQFLPFGSGRRRCPGIPLAEKMVMHVLASFLHSFNWHLPGNEEIDLSDKFGIVMKKRTPLMAIPTPRLSDSKYYD
ncbi:cytochrome P450 71AU50-like [Diospyros lotus]|uniref:cytochrome P450 71AU50-like n=1 Tax=Diospyros lotus TaxID=55363 RepID=UPI00225402E9|nr:cytochrome P450 71AU50-like [Diospyros lotus]